MHTQTHTHARTHAHTHTHRQTDTDTQTTDLNNCVIGYRYTISAVNVVAKVTSMYTSVLHTGWVAWGTTTVDLTHLSFITWVRAAWLMDGL